MSVYIVQALCPMRHCLLALAYEPTGGQDAETMTATLRSHFKELIEAGVMNPWCGLCRSRDIQFENALSKFATLDEAMPEMKKMAEEQAAVRAAMQVWKASQN